MNDLKHHKLLDSAILNIWYDREANNARTQYMSQAAEVYHNKRWALYTTEPTPHKITGKLDDEILKQLYHDSLSTYIQKNMAFAL
jgi:hypothetical protein